MTPSEQTERSISAGMLNLTCRVLMDRLCAGRICAD